MSKENLPKEEGQGQQQQPDIQKGWDHERSGYEKLYSPGQGNLTEGYQPITDISSQPPGGGSGVPVKKDDK